MGLDYCLSGSSLLTFEAMCIQCVAGAMAAGAAASGSRVWIVARAGEWLTPARRRAVTALLIAAGVLGAGAIGPTP